MMPFSPRRFAYFRRHFRRRHFFAMLASADAAISPLLLRR